MVVSRILADPDMRNLLSAPMSTTDASAADEQPSANPSNPDLDGAKHGISALAHCASSHAPLC